MQNIEQLIDQLSPTEQALLLEKIREFKPKGKTKMHVKFPRPVDQITIKGQTTYCLSKNDAIRNLGELMLVDIDKMSSPEIKTRAVGLLTHLAETENEGEKRRTLMMAANVVMEMQRDKLMYKVATLATYDWS